MIWSWLPQWGRPPAPVPPVSTMHHKNGAATLSMFGRKKFGELRQRAFVMRRRLQHLGNELGWPAGLFFDPFLSRMKLWSDMQNKRRAKCLNAEQCLFQHLEKHLNLFSGSESLSQVPELDQSCPSCLPRSRILTPICSSCSLTRQPGGLPFAKLCLVKT